MVNQSDSKHMSAMDSIQVYDNSSSHSEEIKSILISDSFSFFPENFNKLDDNQKVNMAETNKALNTIKDKLRIDGDSKS